MAIMSDPEEPQDFEQAWWHPDPQEQEKWRQAVKKELSDMISHKMWETVSQSQCPTSHHLIGCKWVFKIK